MVVIFVAIVFIVFVVLIIIIIIIISIIYYLLSVQCVNNYESGYSNAVKHDENTSLKSQTSLMNHDNKPVWRSEIVLLVLLVYR